MRTALGRACGLVALLLLALSAGWVLLRRRPVAPATVAAVPPEPSPGPGRDADRDRPATDAGPAGQPVPPADEEPGAPGGVPEVEASGAPTTQIPAVRLSGPDNLRAVRGIGPSMERVLHGLDITTYRQLAMLDGELLERVRGALPDFRSRIEREDWIGQARELHRVKYGETP